jgi:hypothetical protein
MGKNRNRHKTKNKPKLKGFGASLGVQFQKVFKVLKKQIKDGEKTNK